MLRAATLASLLAILPAAPASAADLPSQMPPPVAAAPLWSASFTVYGWMAGLDGKEGLFGLPPVDISVGFLDVLPALDFAGMGIMELRYGRWGLIGDVIYVKLSDTFTGPAGFTTLKLDVSSFIGLAAGSYRIAEGAWGNVDLVAGARIFSMSNKAVLTPPGPLPTLVGKEDATWVDAVGGVKVRFDFSDRWFLTMWGLAGAGGSEFSWDALGVIGYRIDPRWSVEAGYRAIGVRYDSARFTYDVIQHGPVVGVTARF
jgi:hypothetical protein